MAAAAGKQETTSLSSFLEAFGIEVEEELSTTSHAGLGRRSLYWQMVHAYGAKRRHGGSRSLRFRRGDK